MRSTKIAPLAVDLCGLLPYDKELALASVRTTGQAPLNVNLPWR